MLLAAVTGVCRTVPLGAGYRVADLVSELHRHLFAGRRAAVEENLRVVTGLEAPGLCREVFRNYGRYLFEFLRGPRVPGIRCAFERPAIYEAARARGRGVVLAVMHTGNWEIAGSELARGGEPLHAVAGIQLLSRWTPELRRRQAEAGIRILPPGVGSWRSLPRLLGQGRTVALLVDGDVRTGTDPVTLCGRTVPFPSGPAKLCARTGAALVPAFALRLPDGGHVARFLDEVRVDPARPALATQALAARFEEVLREHPGQWMLFRPFFGAPGAAREAA